MRKTIEKPMVANAINKEMENMRIKERINKRVNEQLHITVNHTGKMRGMASLSTLCQINPNCQKYAEIEGSICKECYAMRQTKCYKNMIPCLERNTKLLTERVIPIDELPLLNFVYFRFEAFGDLVNETQLINYFNICKKNPDVHFALWTKNLHIVKRVIEIIKVKKPRNLVIILSSLFVNKSVDINKLPNYIDKVFTVYDKEYIKEHGIVINCGARNCLKCHKCYKKTGDRMICEQKK